MLLLLTYTDSWKLSEFHDIFKVLRYPKESLTIEGERADHLNFDLFNWVFSMSTIDFALDDGCFSELKRVLVDDHVIVAAFVLQNG